MWCLVDETAAREGATWVSVCALPCCARHQLQTFRVACSARCRSFARRKASAWRVKRRRRSARSCCYVRRRTTRTRHSWPAGSQGRLRVGPTAALHRHRGSRASVRVNSWRRAHHYQAEALPSAAASRRDNAAATRRRSAPGSRVSSSSMRTGPRRLRAFRPSAQALLHAAFRRAPQARQRLQLSARVAKRRPCPSHRWNSRGL